MRIMVIFLSAYSLKINHQEPKNSKKNPAEFNFRLT